MHNLAEGMMLFHGSYCVVDNPDIDKCAKHKDFGQGFYLTSSYNQAQSFAKLTTAKAKNNGVASSNQNYGFISCFEVKAVESLAVHSFATADIDWLYCIVAHRKRASFKGKVDSMAKYDVIAGKIANDNTNATIAIYMAGGFGDIESEAAGNVCISLLLPEHLQDQFCFRTEKSLQCLEFKGYKKIWL